MATEHAHGHSDAPVVRNDAIDAVVAAAGDGWGAAVDHRFFRDTREGALPAGVFERYLLAEYAFVATATRFTGAMVRTAPALAARQRLAAGLTHLVHDQTDWFAPVAARRGLELAAAPHVSTDPITVHFERVAAAGGWPEMVACVLGAELLYATWCAAPIADAADPDAADWIALHRGGAFVDHVAWLGDELDRLWPGLDGPALHRVKAAFGGTLRGEVDFHEAVYQPASSFGP